MALPGGSGACGQQSLRNATSFFLTAYCSIRLHKALVSFCQKMHWVMLIGPVREKDLAAVAQMAEDMHRLFEEDPAVIKALSFVDVVREARNGFRGVTKACMNEKLREIVTCRLDQVTGMGDELHGFTSNCTALSCIHNSSHNFRTRNKWCSTATYKNY